MTYSSQADGQVRVVLPRLKWEAIADEVTRIAYTDSQSAQHRLARFTAREEDEFRNGAYATMLASEAVFRNDWDTPEEDATWADL